LQGSHLWSFCRLNNLLRGSSFQLSCYFRTFIFPCRTHAYMASQRGHLGCDLLCYVFLPRKAEHVYIWYTGAKQSIGREDKVLAGIGKSRGQCVPYMSAWAQPCFDWVEIFFCRECQPYIVRIDNSKTILQDHATSKHILLCNRHFNISSVWLTTQLSCEKKNQTMQLSRISLEI
jgi:hypothetical protein